MLKCIIIDDEPLAIQLLSDYAIKSKDLELVGSYTNPLEAFHSLQHQAVDLIFLDIQMPELTGIQFMQLAKNEQLYILTTAYDNYALQGYDFDVVDYLLKPISLDRFLAAVEKAKERKNVAQSALASPIPPSVQNNNFMFVKTGYKTQRIQYDAILYFEGLSDYVAIHTSKEKILTLEKMKHFAQTLPDHLFVRVHKSFIVSIEKIDFIERNRISIGDKYIPIGATYAAAFWEKIK